MQSYASVDTASPDRVIEFFVQQSILTPQTKNDYIRRSIVSGHIATRLPMPLVLATIREDPSIASIIGPALRNCLDLAYLTSTFSESFRDFTLYLEGKRLKINFNMFCIIIS